MEKAEIADTLYIELCSAIKDLANSVDIAIKRMALRAEFRAAIADANEVERAAQLLRSAALSTDDTSEADVSLVPDNSVADVAEASCTPLLLETRELPPVTDPDPPVPEPVSEKSFLVKTSPIVDELYEACRWLSKEQDSEKAIENGFKRKDSAIAERVLALHDRYRWPIK